MMAMMNTAMLNSMRVKPSRRQRVLLPVADVVFIPFLTVGTGRENIVAGRVVLPRISVNEIVVPWILAQDRWLQVRPFPIARNRRAGGLGNQRLQTLLRARQHPVVQLVQIQGGFVVVDLIARGGDLGVLHLAAKF